MGTTMPDMGMTPPIYVDTGWWVRACSGTT